MKYPIENTNFIFMESIENKDISFKLVNGILVATYLCETIDLETARSIIQYRLKHFGNKDFQALVHTNNIKQITKEARKYLASPEACQKVNACAIIASSIVTKVIANFFLRINQPTVPTRLFTDEKNAKQWLAKNKSSKSLL